MSEPSFTIHPTRPKDAEMAALVSAILNSEPVTEAIKRSMSAAYEDMILKAQIRPTKDYIREAMAKAMSGFGS